MTSINQLIPSLGYAGLEIAPALAKLNFDFTLYKVEAPKEYEPVGNALSTCRKENAEEGQLHITARRLGALFEALVPQTPQLLAAYGLRSSEIAEAASIDKRNLKSYGIFESQAGADATSLWAAATSGRGALANHLLACMLARIWDGPEATSIWMEIIERRKQDIKEDFDKQNFGNLDSIMATKQSISRAEIREWDASARAWLRTADGVKKVQQKQLSLIIDNINLPVNQKRSTYDSVLSAWKVALSQMEALLSGVSQTVQDGDILLSLSSWHLYPNLVVVGRVGAHARQQDPLFNKGGMLTVGLQTSPSHNPEPGGIHWSLPLAHLRHYGAPIVSAKSVNSEQRSRLSCDEFLFSSIGCFLRSWGNPGNDTPRAMRFLGELMDALQRSATAGNSNAQVMTRIPNSWFLLMLSTAKKYIASSKAEKKALGSLIMLGRKFGNDFLGLANKPMFGFLESGRFVGFMKSDETKIMHLRNVATDCAGQWHLPPSSIFIRYSYQYPNSTRRFYEYATALPLKYHHSLPKKRPFCESETGHLRHCRWLFDGRPLPRVESSTYLAKLDKHYDQRDWMNVPPDFSEWHKKQGSSSRPHSCAGNMIPGERHSLPLEERLATQKEFLEKKRWLEEQNELVFDRVDQEIEDFDPSQIGIYWNSAREYSMSGTWFHFMYEDLDTAALFICESGMALPRLARPPQVESQTFLDLVERDAMNTDAMIQSLTEDFRFMPMDHDPYLRSLRAVTTAATLYRQFPQASIDIRVLRQKLWAASWLPELGSEGVSKGLKDTSRDTNDLRSVQPFTALKPFHLNGTQVFACLVMFESGVHNISPTQLSNVMAFSSENSIYVAAALMRDPYEFLQSSTSLENMVYHIIGNIGRPGIAFLVPPVDPLIRVPEISDWPRMSHESFDGTLQDSFINTSLHISFTTASVPIATEFLGARDNELVLLETVVSVHDQGEWIADLDILGTMRQSAALSLMPPSCSCQHATNSTYDLSFTCIDDWFELLAPSDDLLCMVRAHKNWQARLAATALSCMISTKATGHHTYVCPDTFCWTCARALFSFRKTVLIV